MEMRLLGKNVQQQQYFEAEKNVNDRKKPIQLNESDLYYAVITKRSQIVEDEAYNYAIYFCYPSLRITKFVSEIFVRNDYYNSVNFNRNVVRLMTNGMHTTN